MPRVIRLSEFLLLLSAISPLVFDRIAFRATFWGSGLVYNIAFGLSFAFVVAGLLVEFSQHRTRALTGRRTVGWGVVFGAAALASAFVGMARGNDIGYIATDLAKFLLLPASLLLASLAIRDRERTIELLAIAVVIYALVCLKNLLLQLFVLDLSLIQRPMSLYLLPAFVLLAWALRQQLRRWPIANIASRTILLIAPANILLADSLALLAMTVLLLCLYALAVMWFGNRRVGTVVTVVALVGGLFLAALIVVGLAIHSSVGGAGSSLLASATDPAVGGYTLNKFTGIAASTTLVDALALAAGNRALFLPVAWTQITGGWLSVLMGDGLGGMVNIPLALLSESLQSLFEESQHFIEMAYPEVFIRTGALGFIPFFATFWSWFRQTRRNLRAAPDALGAVSFSVLAYLLVSFTFYADFPKVGIQSPWMLAILLGALAPSVNAAISPATRR